MSDTRTHIAIFVPSMRGGGAERVMLTLANEFAERGHRVDLVLAKAEGPYLPGVSDKVHLVDLNVPRVLRSLWPLMRYLRRERPDAMLSALNYANVIAILAWKLARVPTRLVVSEHISVSRAPAQLGGKITRGLMRWLYPKADKVVCVSKALEADVQRLIGVPAHKTVTIYNPVDIEMIQQKMQEPVDHPWIMSGTAPVLLAVGRLNMQKDYPTLLQAFKHLRDRREARLIILGQGEEELRLKELAADLGIAGDVDFVGFQNNPFAWMARCDVYVMSSAWEGFGNVLVEAMCAGAAVVSTDCNSGPAEILENGRWGHLVPIGDNEGLSDAIDNTLSKEREVSVQLRIQQFKVDAITQQYLSHVLKPDTVKSSDKLSG